MNKTNGGAWVVAAKCIAHSFSLDDGQLPCDNIPDIGSLLLEEASPPPADPKVAAERFKAEGRHEGMAL